MKADLVNGKYVTQYIDVFCLRFNTITLWILSRSCTHVLFDFLFYFWFCLSCYCTRCMMAWIRLNAAKFLHVCVLFRCRDERGKKRKKKKNCLVASWFVRLQPLQPAVGPRNFTVKTIYHHKVHKYTLLLYILPE